MLLHRLPLRWRLTGVMVGTLALALGLSALTTTALMRTYLTDRTDEELRVAAESSATKVIGSLQRGEQSVSGLPADYVVVIFLRDGNRGAWTAPLDRRYQPQIPQVTVADPALDNPKPFTVGSIVGDVDWRVLRGRLSDGTGSYAVAASLKGVEQTLGQMRLLTSVIGLLLMAAGGIIGWAGLRRAFRPLRQIEDTAAAIAAGDLTRRVPEPAADDEVATLSRSLNAMLAQVEESFAAQEKSERRMRQFVTDASHELRTPLATMRGYAELYRQGAASSPDATAAAMTRIEDEAHRMGGLVEDLLTLARIDNQRPMETDPVDLTVVAGDVVQDARARAPERSIRLVPLSGGSLGPRLVLGDEARLRQVVTNLVANALAHTPDGTPVEVGLSPMAPTLTVTVSDHGPGIPGDEVRSVFERFYRGDPARTRQSRSGSGLGLSIVAAIVEAHGGRVGIAETPGGGATFVVELPGMTSVPVDEEDEVDDDPTDTDIGTDETDTGSVTGTSRQ